MRKVVFRDIVCLFMTSNCMPNVYFLTNLREKKVISDESLKIIDERFWKRTFLMLFNDLINYSIHLQH